MPISFCENMFKNQKSVQEFIKNTIEQCKFYELIDKNHIHFNVFTALLKVHFHREHKLGNGVKHFYFAHNLYRKKELQIVRIDNSEVSMSCTYSKIIKDNNPYQDLRAAMRYSICDQIQIWKQQQVTPFICQMCFNQISLIQADHIYPFSRMVTDFLDKNKYEIPTELFKNKHNMLEFRKEDNEFQTAWTEYHYEFATFQILCIKCNCKKGDKYTEINISP